MQLLLQALHALRRRDAPAVSDLFPVHRATIQWLHGGAALEGAHLKTGPCARLVRRVDDVDVRFVARSSIFVQVVVPACTDNVWIGLLCHHTTVTWRRRARRGPLEEQVRVRGW